MEILLLTKEGSGIGFAHRLACEGHDVSVFSDKINLSSSEGLYKVSTSLWASVKSARFVIADSPGWGKLKDKIAIYNRPVIGMSNILELAQTDAVKQYELFTRFGIPVPESKVFSDAGEMFEFSLDWEANRTVIRYDGTEIRCDYRNWLPWGMTKVPLGKKILFQKSSYGYEYIVSGWFNGLKWIDNFGISPAISGEIYKYAVNYPISPDNKLIAETLLKLEPIFKSLEYHGPIYIKVAVHKEEICATHIYIGFLYPLAYTQLEFIEGELGEFLHNIAYSISTEPKKTKDYVSAIQSECVEKEFVGAPILGINAERLKHLVFHSVSKDLDEYRIASGRCILTATAHGPSLDESVERAYKTVENIKFPEKHYNSNLNSIAYPYFNKLREWKYI